MKSNVKVGVDIVDIKRIERVLEKNDKAFLKKLFSEEEINSMIKKASKANSIAGIFSAKEAVSKLLGSGIGEIKWKDIEVFHDINGKPYINLNKKIKSKLASINISNIDISISHEREYAIATAIGIGSSKDEKLELAASMKNKIVKRKTDTHKGNYGRVGIIAGSKGMTGAAYLTGQAALRCGSGLVYSIVPESIEGIMSTKFTEVIVKGIEDDARGYFTRNSLREILGAIENMDLIAVGPGMGVDGDRRHIVEEIIKRFKKPIVLDADGINCIRDNPDILYSKNKDIIITPHPGELASFLGKSTKAIQENRLHYAKYLSDKYNIVVILKGAATIVASPGQETYVNTTGNPGMASAGSGDVLTGMITSFIGQGLKAFDAAKLGVFTHGLAGDEAKEEKGEYGLIASDIIDCIPRSIKLILD